MWRRAASGSPAARQALVASGVTGGVAPLLPALDLQHDQRLGSIAVRVQRDRAGDAGVVLRSGDQIAQLLLCGLALGAAGLRRGKAPERCRVVRGDLLQAV